MARPKVCFVIPEYRKDTATHFAHVYDLLKTVSKNLDIFLIIEKGEMPEGKRMFSHVRLLSSSSLTLRILGTLWVIIRARKEGYSDFYIHYSFFSAFLASLVAGISGGRVFYWNAGEPWKYKRGKLREAFERMAYRRVTFLVTGTESLKKRYALTYDIPGEKIKVLPNWISLERFKNLPDGEKDALKKKLGISDGAKVVLFAHRLSERKGVQHLPDILSSFAGGNIVFLVVGDGPECKNLKFKIENLKLQKNVRLLGWIPNAEMPKYYAIADLFIMPSDEEGFPRVLLEAMAMGIPFVAFGVGGVLEVVPSELKNLVVTSGAKKQFVGAMNYILNSSHENILIIQKREKEWVKKFNVKEVAKMFEELFKI
ncbi:MAG: hypothetical protein A3H69_05000 [Candidatus Sungbacteria bacterium RIFCSPLOWO2_02_FULL_47_9]|uniref:Glycosyl transferase family 1 domain-containing protein n=1 Tax=Candidatus Sungbacteria bacterium RIFCSPHIGHO2_01_FULL_47_32 TaxID=1802264 RepID=A0A1G2K643_9BACT|nr:MAG: Glycosyltransferase [Parcubacteria group bacterium GW2011_GWA2_47_10]OGZ94653.1 MAG: hypothetical protein A2633_01385 [Candidatus Sungbacteria bacterium RIFCSPHIGHO2_01_FULL_47_32]OGZ98162.1 MAG: hypothetical protein A3D57_03020 [Candidatus Sungbacteria bacterium RIFCSPHIGHO2_02_FULL_46_12]OHA04817.1 MAG: hypothetical protein A3A28_04920 [Candidatus Sungbacteria bacterium RIFCSPLOWO2_01_FULL_47_32]OHA11985.1 MAG: hypothetical protein A3H69_05000 [Candidatus Sungbacteria bacterium RIFCSP